MDIKKEIRNIRSKQQAKHIAIYVGNHPDKFKEVMHAFFQGPYRLTQWITWTILLCLENYPNLIQPYFGQMVDTLKAPVTAAIKRNTIRIWQNLDIPKPLQGAAANICFDFLSSNAEPIAVKVFSMTVLLNLTKKNPELARELKILVEDQMPYGSPGFKSRGTKTLAALNKMGV